MKSLAAFLCPALFLLAMSPSLSAAGPPSVAPADDTLSAESSNPDGSLDKESMDITYRLRIGLSGDFAPSSPNFYGLGSAAEATLIFADTYAVGLRMNGSALVGFGITDEISAGARALGGILAKGELLLRDSIGTTRGVGVEQTQIVIGAAAGTYRIASVAGSVSRNISEEKRDGLNAFAIGGRAFGVAPQIGFQKGRVRLSALSHLIFSRHHVDPVFAIELAFKLM